MLRLHAWYQEFWSNKRLQAATSLEIRMPASHSPLVWISYQLISSTISPDLATVVSSSLSLFVNSAGRFDLYVFPCF